MLRGRTVRPDTRAIIVPATQRDLPRGAGRGPARRVRRGRRDGLDADLRRVLRRRHGRPRRRRERDHDDEPQLPGRMGSSEAERAASRTRGSRRRPRSQARSSTRRELPRRCRRDRRGPRASSSASDDVDTDVLYPGAYLNITDVEKMKRYLFEGLDPRCATSSAATRRSSSAPTSARARRASTFPRRCARPGIRFLVGHELRADLLPQLHQPRPAGRCVAPDGGRRGAPGSALELDLDGGTVDGRRRGLPDPAGAAVHARDVRRGRPRAVDARRISCLTLLPRWYSRLDLRTRGCTS